MRLLMIEDSAAYAALVRAQLADASAGEVRVRHVPTLQAALEAVRREWADASSWTSGCPTPTGSPRSTRCAPPAPGLPIVVLTAWTQDELALRAVRSGAQDVLVKGDTPPAALLRAPAPCGRAQALRGAARHARDERCADRSAQPRAAAGADAPRARPDGLGRRSSGRPAVPGPDEFIGTAEDTGLIRRLGAWVLDEACAQLAAWRAAGLAADVTMAVNLSPRQLDDDALLGRIASALERHDLDAGSLVLEVTGDALADDDGAALERIAAVKALGVGIALDARAVLGGAPPATLGRAARRLAQARPLVRRPAGHGAAGAADRHRRARARRLDGPDVVAEGIEDDECAETLAALGCATGRGRAFSPAVPAIDVEPLLAHVAPRPADRIRVYLCDDAPHLRALLRTFLEWGGDVDVVGEAGDGEGLADAVREVAADVVLLDLSMPRVDGLEALVDLRAADPDLGIVVLSGFEPTRMEARALALGADRYLEKAAGMEDVRATVRAVAAGRRGPGALLEAVA